MALFLDKPGKKPDRTYAQMSLLAAVPAIILVAPLVGFFMGKWADKRFGTDPFLMIAGILFGLASAGYEIYRLVKKAQDLEKDDSVR